jgi:hypothetical protein
LWFYVGNPKPTPPNRTGGVLKSQPEWKKNPPKGDMEQVEELILLIQVRKEMGITRASVMCSFFERRI